ncbi:electron transfer flavoprotein subunit alpha/FixB family protein [Sporomusa sp. KB1]|jgi:electron transfer flavoprotein alpha subunit|uniref:electron transfer flavoprotein subunit alpha/FixB family protein n=1 Tax=Sporomusa sp. KB1 TaxID=943346 RepID=UPI0011A824D0|nr:electron transfer flavoprotein subunit alpha/FixB family protein [Sporomusa sp. KB1]TWH46746.1 electron transfer flavoprotein alpha subunit apoprotein [Sporomusa sp. KB1]
MGGIYIYSDRTIMAAELIGFAKKSGKSANVITFNETAANEIAQYGADQVYVFKGDSPLAENYAKAVADFLRNERAELFVVGATARGRDIAARVAGYLECSLLSEVSTIVLEGGTVSTTRMVYGGAVIQSEAAAGMAVVTIPSGKFEAVQGGTSEVAIVSVKADDRVSLLESTPIVRSEVDLSAADKIVCIGLGMEKKEDMQLAIDLAEVLGAEIGCTRSVSEEKHWLPNYIGISGLTIRPSLYLAMGVSGQVQHLVGVRDSKIIVAINTNEKAPIFNGADYGIVGDLYEIAPLLTKELKSTNAG